MSRKRRLTAEAMFEWASSRARTSEAGGRGTRYPTLKEAARRYRMSYEDLEEVLDEGTEKGYIGLAVGVRTGAGIGLFKERGDCLVEAYP